MADAPYRKESSNSITNDISKLPILEFFLGEMDLDSGCKLGPIQRPDPEFIIRLDLIHSIKFANNLLQHIGIIAPIQQNNNRILGNPNSRVNGHNGEQVCTEGISQLPVSPLLAIGIEEYYQGRDDDTDGEDYVTDDVDVGRLNVYVCE